MGEVLEVVRFTVEQEERDAFLAGRGAGIDALAGRFDALIEAPLAEYEDGDWIDVLRWRDLDSAKAAAEVMMQIPKARDWAAHIAAVRDFRHAAVHHRFDAAAADFDRLVARAQRGDRAALEAVCARARPMLTRHARRLLGPSADVEDAVQEVLIVVTRRIGSYRWEGSFAGWLCAVATRTMLRTAASAPVADPALLRRRSSSTIWCSASCTARANGPGARRARCELSSGWLPRSRHNAAP